MDTQSEFQVTTVEDKEKLVDEPYGLLKERLKEQREKYGRDWTLFLDIDGTALRDGVDNTSLYTQADEGLWGLTYVTGTDFPRMIQLIKDDKIKRPLAATTNLGTRRFYLKPSAAEKSSSDLTEDDYVEDKEFKVKIEQSGFNKNDIYERLSSSVINKLNTDPKLGHFNLRLLWLEDTFEAQKYEAEWIPRDPHKFDLYITSSPTTTEAELKEYQSMLQSHFPECDILMYPGRTFANKDIEWNVHILPKDAWGKDRFVKDMSTSLNTKGLIAGDSSNDLSQLLGTYPGTGKDFIRAVVGGSKDDLLKIVRDENINDIRRGSLRRLNINEEYQVRMYDERNQETKGPDSIVYLMRLLERSWRRFGQAPATAA